MFYEMKKLVKFTGTKRATKDVSAEVDIQLPAYFLRGGNLSPLSEYFCIVKITDPNKVGQMIINKGFNQEHMEYQDCVWSNFEVVTGEADFTPTTKEKWDEAVNMIINEIKGL